MADVGELPAGKREQTKVQNRQAILDAARAVFGERGYKAATVRDIIGRTGLAAGTFYNYYRSKEEIVAALSDDGARRFAPILKALRGKGAPLEQFVREAIEAYFQFSAEEHHTWMALLPAGKAQPVVQTETPGMKAVFDEVKDAIEATIAEGAGHAMDAEYMTAACIGVAREVCERMLARRPIEVGPAADFASRMILTGLKGLPGGA